MQKDLSNYRLSYEQNELLETNVPNNPMDLFNKWFEVADKHEGIKEANAMNVATLGLDGFPKNRIVLLKQIVNQGFVFFTNYTSEKGKAVAAHPQVCLSFFWPPLEQQIIIKGTIEKADKTISDTYFSSRPKGSRLGALASNQSEIIASRAVLESKLEELNETYKDQEINRPEHWGGYIVKPVSFEFWQGRPNRLHDRILYTEIENSNWKMNRLAP